MPARALRLVQFARRRITGGLVLLAATALAVAWASSPLAGSYHAVWALRVLGAPLHEVVNEGLMTVFFFAIGLELRHGLGGQSLRQAAVPVVAAAGGMLVPALLYVACNAGRPSAGGWGVPVATDIAFAVGVLAVLGARVVPPQRLLLLAIAVIDDLGAVLVVAFGYATGGGSWLGLAVGGLALAAVAVLQRLRIACAPAYLVPAIALWLGMLLGGVHPALAGAALGALTPVHAFTPGAEAPARRWQRVLPPWIDFAVMPAFALANAGVDLGGVDLGGDGGRVFAGIVLGLALGKPIGILLACRALRPLVPPPVTGRPLLVVGAVAGVGFAMSLFIAQLAFPPGPLLETARVAVLAGSAVAAVLGLAIGYRKISD